MDNKKKIELIKKLLDLVFGNADFNVQLIKPKPYGGGEYKFLYTNKNTKNSIFYYIKQDKYSPNTYLHADILKFVPANTEIIIKGVDEWCKENKNKLNETIIF